MMVLNKARMYYCVALMVVFVKAIGSNSPPVSYSRYKLTDAGCVEVDELCLVPEEVPNYEAIRSLHYQLDDDRSGDIDLAESVDFLKEELQYHKGYEKRQKTFHYNNDQYISVAELWYIWKNSEVHNWTVDQTVGWLAESVELQQYSHTFYQNAVNGSILPRMAANNEQFLTKVLGIKDPKHRSKITIKAMDVVLFGPPKETGSHMKDLVLVSLLTLALIGCFKAYQRNRQYQGQLSDMLRDMEKLREAEENLQQLEKKMTSKVQSEEGRDERRGSTGDSHARQEVQQLKLQLEEERVKNEQMKEQMKRNVEEESSDGYTAPRELQLWLQLTCEKERLACEKKQSSAKEQFNQAREMCEKLNKQRRSLMGMLASVHGKMDSVDQAISMARTTMEEVTQELRERNQRWQHIEDLAGCDITTNPGLHTLELMLRPHINTRPHSYGSSIGAASTFHHNLVNTPGLTRTPRDSTMDLKVMSTSSLRKKNLLLQRDSGSSLGSEAGITHSHTFSSDVSQIGDAGRDEGMRRVWSVGSLQHQQHNSTKDSTDSSTDETDFSIGPSDRTSFTMGGSNKNKEGKKSRLTLNSENTIVSQVSDGPRPPSPSSSTSSHPGFRSQPTTEIIPVNHHPVNNSKKRGMMHKSYSHDVDVLQMANTKLEGFGSVNNINNRSLRGKKSGRPRPPGVMRRHSSDELDQKGGRNQKARRHSVAVSCFLPHHPNATIMEESTVPASPHLHHNGFHENSSDEKEKISSSEPALDSPMISTSAHHRRKVTSTVEEGNSSDSSLFDDHLSQTSVTSVSTVTPRLPINNKKRHGRGGRFTNGFLGSLKLGKSKKGKDAEIIHKESAEKI